MNFPFMTRKVFFFFITYIKTVLKCSIEYDKILNIKSTYF